MPSGADQDKNYFWNKRKQPTKKALSKAEANRFSQFESRLRLSEVSGEDQYTFQVRRDRIQVLCDNVEGG